MAKRIRLRSRVSIGSKKEQLLLFLRSLVAVVAAAAFLFLFCRNDISSWFCRINILHTRIIFSALLSDGKSVSLPLRLPIRIGNSRSGCDTNAIQNVDDDFITSATTITTTTTTMMLPTRIKKEGEEEEEKQRRRDAISSCGDV